MCNVEIAEDTVILQDDAVNINNESEEQVPQSICYNIKEPISLIEALEYFNDESKAINEMPDKPSDGEVILFKAKDISYGNDWSSNGHRWYQANGGRWALGGQLKRKISHCVTPDTDKKGTNSFMMISWNHWDKPLFTLVQFVGDHTISVDFPW